MHCNAVATPAPLMPKAYPLHLKNSRIKCNNHGVLTTNFGLFLTLVHRVLRPPPRQLVQVSMPNSMHCNAVATPAPLRPKAYPLHLKNSRIHIEKCKKKNSKEGSNVKKNCRPEKNG